MKSIILLTVIACSYGAKLNRGYLPPEHAQTSSGSEFLETPISQPIVVAEEAVFHKSNAEANLGPQHQQTINGFVQIGSHGNGFAHGIEDNTSGLQHQQPGNGFIQVGGHASSLAHGAEALEHVNLKVVEQRPERTQAAIERHAAILRQDYQNDGKGYAYVYETDNGIYGEENGVATHGVIAQGAFSYTGDDGVQYSITYTADENGFQPHGDHLPTPPPIPEEILKSLEQNARDEAAGIFDDGSYHAEKYGDKAEYIANDAHIENQAAHAVIINEHEPVVHAEDGEAVVNTVLLPETIQRPVFRNPGLEHQVVVNVPVVASNVNKGYLPPVHQALLEDRSAQNGKIVFGTRHRQPSFNSKKGYQY